MAHTHGRECFSLNKNGRAVLCDVRTSRINTLWDNTYFKITPGLSGSQRSAFTSPPAESVAGGLRAEGALKNMATETCLTSLESSKDLGGISTCRHGKDLYIFHLWVHLCTWPGSLRAEKSPTLRDFKCLMRFETGTIWQDIVLCKILNICMILRASELGDMKLSPNIMWFS